MTDDPRKPKVIIPEDANFMTALKHKQALEARRQELLNKILMQGDPKNTERHVYLKKMDKAADELKQKEAKNG